MLAGGELTWERAAQVDVGDLLFQAGVWIAIAFFAVVRFLVVYRPADPTRGLGNRAEIEKCRPRPGGETAVIFLGVIVMVLTSSGMLASPVDVRQPQRVAFSRPLATGGLGGVVPASIAGHDRRRRVR